MQCRFVLIQISLSPCYFPSEVCLYFSFTQTPAQKYLLLSSNPKFSISFSTHSFIHMKLFIIQHFLVLKTTLVCVETRF